MEIFIITFTAISGMQKTKTFKTFKAAKKHYDKYVNNMGLWYNITLTKKLD